MWSHLHISHYHSSVPPKFCWHLSTKDIKRMVEFKYQALQCWWWQIWWQDKKLNCISHILHTFIEFLWNLLTPQCTKGYLNPGTTTTIRAYILLLSCKSWKQRSIENLWCPEILDSQEVRHTLFWSAWQYQKRAIRFSKDSNNTTSPAISCWVQDWIKTWCYLTEVAMGNKAIVIVTYQSIN